MRAYIARRLWIHMKQFSIYLVLGFISALIAIGLSSPFETPWAGLVRVIVFVAGLLSIEILVIREGPEGS